MTLDFRGFTTNNATQATLVRISQAVAIACNQDVYSRPSPQISWLKDQKPIHIDNLKYLMLNDGKLVIYQLTTSDITTDSKPAEYQCMVTNANVTETVLSPTVHTLYTGMVQS